ncbi:MAG: helix-turn-helix transcriptional regulator [Candidatus Kerfeldbacteria bacterium]|nr:helix-turn-helix transcriptional regulator [Candidatus Kerfeldbacteria bacterium]
MVRIVSQYNEECPPEINVIDSVSGKWTVVIVSVLSQKTRRNGELKRLVSGISHKVLTQTLRRLERDGIVARKVFPVVPPQVEYSLTSLGKSLVGLLSDLRTWSAAHYGEVKKARTKYDSRPKEKIDDSIVLDKANAKI